jgi:predicted nucleotidyltransferase
MKQNDPILPSYLKSRLPAIQQICLSHQVKYLWAMGSVLTDQFGDHSDVDLLYELDRTAISDAAYLPNLDGFIEALLNLFEGRQIDLIHYPSLKNPYFIEEVEETKVLLYEQEREEVTA